MNSFKQGTFFLQEWNQCDLQRNHLFLSCFSSIQDWSSFCTKCCKGKKHFLKNNSVHGIPEMANQFLVRNITQGKHFFCFLLLNLDSIISRRTKGNNFHMLFKAKITQATIKEPAKRGKAIKSDRVIHMKSEWIRDRITLFIHTYHHWQCRSKQATTTKNPKKIKLKILTFFFDRKLSKSPSKETNEFEHQWINLSSNSRLWFEDWETLIPNFQRRHFF